MRVLLARQQHAQKLTGALPSLGVRARPGVAFPARCHNKGSFLAEAITLAMKAVSSLNFGTGEPFANDFGVARQRCAPPNSHPNRRSESIQLAGIFLQCRRPFSFGKE